MIREVMRDRVYESGTGIQWCIWRWSDAQEPYLLRLFLFKTPWFAASINWIKQADVGCPHDHTSDFFSIFLRGWYIERRIKKDRWTLENKTDRHVKRMVFNWVRGAPWDVHRILDVAPETGAVTLCLMGSKRREWFYHTEDGPVHWAEYKEKMNERE